MSYGYIQDEVDYRDIWADEILAGDNALPIEHLPKKLSFENQGKWPLCVSMAVTKLWEMFLVKKLGIHKELSQMDLFFNSGGTEQGSGFRNNLWRAKNFGCHSYVRFPLLKDLDTTFPKMFFELKGLASILPLERENKILGFVRVKNDKESIKQTTLSSGGVLVGVYANGGYFSDKAKRRSKKDNHGTVCDGWDKNGNWRIADSLPNKSVKTWDGYHFLDKDYVFNSVYAITELPENYKEFIEIKRQEFENCLNRYGKQMNYMAEVQAENDLHQAFKKNNNPALYAFAMRDRQQLINARAYGGYNFQYTKWGIWHAGDLINYEYAKMTGCNLPFNLDEIKK